ncbi:hypothetical protein [Streptomyces europaeiscabiei]|uniref:hypothetical protein n=1 Tax=Streptomyces europaeiscabiei TaxID=146819 RepID=UPI0029A181E7|nr:hypothetical protein [Streptomyces europaeiscabiei]MDX2765644.1 hypothetical protein [Streptomyces europaeiscabiei]
MTYRPYPNADRARHQIERHDDETPPLGEPRPMTPFEQQLARNAQEILKAAQPTLALASARLRAAFRPRPVGGEETSG